MIHRNTCPVCEGSNIVTLLRIPQVPTVSNRLCNTRAIALSALRADVSLAFCSDCCHAFNQEYDKRTSDYNEEYENRLSCSDVFRKYDARLVENLIRRYNLHDRTVVEIGSGSGEFLRALCTGERNRGFGFDPAHCDHECNGGTDAGVSFLAQNFDRAYPELAADFICSRHTLEHMPEPRRVVENVRRTAAKRGVPVFFEVPNLAYTIRENCIWDIIYEHCSYFSAHSLAWLFAVSGYRVMEVSESFGGQFLTIHALVDSPVRKPNYRVSSALELHVRDFAEQYRATVQKWRHRMCALERDRRRVVVWGAGAKGTTFLNTLRPPNVEFVVDMNPHKHDKYLTGTGQRIVPPGFLRQYKPDAVIVMNPIYSHEISELVRSLDVRAEFFYA